MLLNSVCVSSFKCLFGPCQKWEKLEKVGGHLKGFVCLGRICVGLGFFCYFGLGFLFFGWLLVLGISGGGGVWFGFGFCFVFCNFYLFCLKPKRIKTTPKIRIQLICSHIEKIWLQNVLQPWPSYNLNLICCLHCPWLYCVSGACCSHDRVWSNTHSFLCESGSAANEDGIILSSSLWLQSCARGYMFPSGTCF